MSSKLLKTYVKPELIKKTIGITLILFVFYVLSLTLVYCIPREAMLLNATESAVVIGQEGKYPNWFFGSPVAFFDNYSDARMLNMAVHTGDNPFYGAMSTDYEVIEGSEDTEFAQFHDLVAAVEGNSTGTESYGRMWHGYLVWLKPLLVFFNLHEIRSIIYFLSFFLYLVTILVLNKKAGFKVAFPFICGTLLSYTVITTINMMFSIDINYMILGVLAVAVLYGTKFYEKYEYLLFWLIGTLMAFSGTFMFLLITLCMPLLVSLQLHYKSGKSAKDLWYITFRNSVFYVVSYAITLILKWVLAAIIVGSSDGGSVSTGWIGLPDSIVAYLYRLFTIVTGFLTPISATLVLIGIILVSILVLIIKFHSQEAGVLKLLPFVFIACYPAFWTLVIFKHSGHGFTRFLMMICVDAFLWILLNFIDEKKLKENLKKKVQWTGLID